jgi:hypothetical protein
VEYLKRLVIVISLVACLNSVCYADELYVNWEADPVVADGQVPSNHNDRPDIGVVQYDAQPHEYSTYTFPAGNDRNGIKWMSFPSLDRLYGVKDMAFTLLSTMEDDDIISLIEWKELNYPSQNLQLFNNTWLGDNTTYNLKLVTNSR